MSFGGDWKCWSCGFKNFASRNNCKNCSKATKPNDNKSNSNNNVEMKKGDWNCMGCGFANFSSRTACKNCGKDNMNKGNNNGNILVNNNSNNNMDQMKKGDWNCGGCGFNNFASRDTCKNCSLSKSLPSSNNQMHNNQMYEKNRNGEWVCMGMNCGYVNERGAQRCMKCNIENGESISMDRVMEISKQYQTKNDYGSTFQQHPSNQQQVNNINNNMGNNVEVKKGDWSCGGCGFNNFASRDTCKNCNLAKSQPSSLSNFGNNINSNNSNSNNSNFGNSNNFGNNNNIVGNNVEVKKGDWNCESCKFLNFASRDSCKNCGTFKSVNNNNNSNSSSSNNNNFNNNGNNNNQSNVIYYEDLNNDNVSNYYIKEFCQKSKSKEVFSEQLVSSYHSLSSTKAFPKTSIALERLYQTVKNESNCFNDCRKVAEACLEDIYFFLNNQNLSGMLFDKIETFKNMIKRNNGPETATLNMVATYVNFVRHLGNQDSHFQVSTPNVMDSVVALSVTLQMCYSLLVVYHIKQKK
eukprot:TRINITY_DN116_c0_g1_i1.p1 TRINITY_DN116_c0_g1~~TRINITY_DN116_c0_g1_i1.p1  ORF type:complete len:522 (+),score=168.82 TRINITY_DN116_c0_g1_i1:26-1591(+)